MKLAERLRGLEARVEEIERHPALNVAVAARSRAEAARIAGKRSAEVRRAKNGSAQPKARAAFEPAEPPAASGELARTARTFLDDTTQVYRSNAELLSAVQKVTVAWSAPFGIGFVRLGDSPAADTDLRAILEALAAGYSVGELDRAGDLGANDAALLAEESPGPSSFTAEVLARLIGAPGTG